MKYLGVIHGAKKKGGRRKGGRESWWTYTTDTADEQWRSSHVKPASDKNGLVSVSLGEHRTFSIPYINWLLDTENLYFPPKTDRSNFLDLVRYC